jgi:hypothetical protein
MKFQFPVGIYINNRRLRKHFNADWIRAFAVAVLVAGMCQLAAAATLYVNPGGTYPTIQAAVDAAAAGDTVQVAPGTYFEDVIIGKPLSLVGAGCGRSIINAMGLPIGIWIDGIDHPNPRLSNVVVTGFTIENANFEGILVTNASFITIFENEVINNDKSLVPPGEPNGPECPGIPGFETNEGFDCGEGIHLSGVDHSVVSNNTSKHNAGGILLSDDTGATHDNLITGNVVMNNPFDCGITLASHAAFPVSSPPFGVFHNTIAENESSNNGLAVEGAGAGVGIFDSIPGTQNYGNVVINNRLENNGLPGVAMHSHTPGQNLNDNLIVGNRISGNGADTEDAATPGPTGINVFGVSPITGTVISGNVIDDEAVDIATNTPAQVNVHLNDLLGENIGVDNISTDKVHGTVDATENWWGSPGGPGKEGATTVNGVVFFTPWLRHPIPEVSPPEDDEKGNQGDDGRNKAEQ